MVLAKSTTNLMQRLSSLPTVPDVSLLRRRKTVPSSLSHKHHLHIRWCCIDRLRPPRLCGNCPRRRVGQTFLHPTLFKLEKPKLNEQAASPDQELVSWFSVLYHS